ncbi:MAG: tetratricopeptide repeat protein [Pseudomonadota bacterium]
MKHLAFCLLALAPSAGLACPQARDITSEMTALIDEINAAPDQMAGEQVSAKMWELWLDAPDAAAQSVLDRGMQQRASYDFAGALESFTKLIKYCPDYAEGYNQRAFIHFLTDNHAKALVDLDRALSLSPRHVGAQSGRALTLMNLGQLDEARDQLRAALENNPWLSERFLLADGGPLAPKGQEL